MRMRRFREITKKEKELLLPKIEKIQKEIDCKCELIENSASDEENGVTIFNYKAEESNGDCTYILGIYKNKVYSPSEMGLDTEKKQWGYKLMRQ